MGLFKSEDKKEKERLDKEQKVLEKYGVENLSDPACFHIIAFFR